jgi:hypothetical protein
VAKVEDARATTRMAMELTKAALNLMEVEYHSSPIGVTARICSSFSLPMTSSLEDLVGRRTLILKVN